MVFVTTPARAGIFMNTCDELTYLPKISACFLKETFFKISGYAMTAVTLCEYALDRCHHD